MAAVPSSVSVHRKFAEGEEFRNQVRSNGSRRVRGAALKPTNVQCFANTHKLILGVLVSREVFEIRHAVQGRKYAENRISRGWLMKNLDFTQNAILPLKACNRLITAVDVSRRTILP
jgi:hypothetical protein